MFSSPVMAYTLDDIEWSDGADAKGTLKWGDTLKSGDYTIKVEDFNTDGFVSIGVYREGQLMKKSPARSGEGFEFRDTDKGEDLRIFVTTVTLNIDNWSGNMINPTAAVEVYERGIPEMGIVIGTDKDTYDPRTLSPQYITATIDIDNEGDAQAYDMDVVIDVDGMELADGKLKHHFTSIEEDEVLDPIKVKLKIPHYWEKTKVDITVTTRSEDINGDIYEDTKTKTLTIEPVVELVISKTVTDEIYMDKTAHVSVSIWNNGIYDVSSVKVSNPTTSDLEIQDSITKEVTLSFNAKETKAKIFEYTLKPTKTGTFTIPAATATFTAPDGNKYTFTSDTSKIVINGPDIVLTKEVSPTTVNPGVDVTVKVTVKNQGNRDASVITSETISDSVTFVSGDRSFHDVATKGKSFSYSYVVRVDEIGELKLPETTATFIDFEGYKGEKVSNAPIINVVDPSAEPVASTSSSSSGSTATNQQTSSSGGPVYESDVSDDRVQPGFEASFMILALFGVYFISRRRDRS
ncbi:BatD family protein [Methanolobus psychrotolerans]|uniref:BatD family protein n=1 Tax=Methanolobus psychrotolerans TaxID=1874706 RepID=UPI0013EBD62C|nr:BatD family protein [Methanolobus psychrotolerans]